VRVGIKQTIARVCLWLLNVFIYHRALRLQLT